MYIIIMYVHSYTTIEKKNTHTQWLTICQPVPQYLFCARQAHVKKQFRSI